MTTVLVILIVVAVLGASLVGNFLLYQQNAHLTALVGGMAEENERLTDALSEHGAKPVEQPAGVGREPSEPDDGPPERQPAAGDGFADSPAYGSQSITAVAVRPLVMREAFFERTQYEGTIMEILVSVREQGAGLVLVDTEVPTGISFQESARTAVKVAGNYLGESLSDRDVVFSITAGAGGTHLQTVDGHSAGAAMAVLLISELQGKSIRGDVVITGSILPDASIGTVGGVSEKAETAGRHGAGVFLVPSGQNVTAVESCEESRAGNFVYRSCTLEEKLLSPITEKTFGMEVREVADIGDAVLYFQGNTRPS